MLTLQAKEKEIEITTPEEFIRGTVGAKCKIIFDDFWFSKNYRVYVVFKRDGYEPIEVEAKNPEEEIEIPYNILAESGEYQIGVYGENETETTPTLYSDKNRIRYGTDTHATNPPIYKPSVIYRLQNDVGEINRRLDDDYYTKKETDSTFVTDEELIFDLNNVNTQILKVDKKVNNLDKNLEDNYYTKTDIYNFDFADKKYVNEAIDGITAGGGEVDLSNYYPKEHIDNLPAVKHVEEGEDYVKIYSPNTNTFITLNDNYITYSSPDGFDADQTRIFNVGEPKEPTDAATKGYVDSVAGDIETALDELHNYAQALINGGAE